MTPELHAAAALRCDPTQLHSERIKRGLTNQSWRVQGAGHDVIVRISTADEHALQLNRVSEAHILDVVQHAGIGAKVIRCDPTARVLITQTLPGHEWTEAQACDANNIVRLATLLRRLHALPVDRDVQSIGLFASLHGYWSELTANSIEFNDDSTQRERALRIAQASDAVLSRCLCHTDLHHFNIIDNGERLWIVDWEYAGSGDAYFDLASVCCWHDYDVELQRALLNAYLGASDDRQLLRLQELCWLFDYIKALWFAVREVSLPHLQTAQQ